MKAIILTITAVFTASDLFGQGVITFTSRSAEQTSHVWGPSSTNPSLSLVGPGSNDSPAGLTPYAADGMALIGASGGGSSTRYGYASTFAQMLVAIGLNQPESSLLPVGQVTTFRSGTYLGDIAPIDVTVPGLLDGAATCEAVAWDNSSHAYPTWTEASVAWLAGSIAAGRAGSESVLLVSGRGTYTHSSFSLYFVPEPATATFAGLGAAALMVLYWKKRG